MNVIFDYIMAGIIFGILALTIARVHVTMSSTQYQNTYTVITQRNAVELARQIENDFLKMGYRVRGQTIFFADKDSIRFRVGYINNNKIDTPVVRYYIGRAIESVNTPNPNDFPIYRRYDNDPPQRLNYGLTSFRMQYYNINNAEILTPDDSLDKIRSVFVRFSTMGPEPVISLIDTTYSAIGWQKLLIPRNLWRTN